MVPVWQACMSRRGAFEEMTRAKRGDYIYIRSVHKAGHAIAAIRMRLRFSYVSIESALLPDTGGLTVAARLSSTR